MSKFLSLVLSSAIFFCSLSSVVNAYETDTESDLYLISKTETVLEDGTIVVDEYYSDSPEKYISTYSAKAVTSGTETVRHSRKFTQSATCAPIDLVTVSVEAVFSWNSINKTATVDTSTIKTDYIIHGEHLSYYSQKTDYGNNMGDEVFFGHKYAYVRYYLTLKSSINSNLNTYTVYIDMNTQGTPSRNDGISNASFSLLPELS